MQGKTTAGGVSGSGVQPEAEASSPDPVIAATAAYVVIALTLFASGILAIRWFGVAHHHGKPFPQGFVNAWNRWDAGWYRQIASRGYSYSPGKQSTVAFFPAYPLIVRAVSAVMRVGLAGIVVTVASGAAAVALFEAWTRRFLDRPASLLAVALLLLYPYSFYLYGAVYSDAFFLAAALAAFLFLETRHPLLSGLCGAAAAAARPVGIALVIALALRNIELERAAGGDERPSARTFAPALLTMAGLVAYMTFLWLRFRAPLAFVNTEAGWHQAPGPATWFKVSFFQHIATGSAWNISRYSIHAVMTVVALAFVPTVWRRFGRAYAVYALAAILIPAVSTKDFFSMARYVLAAFPCFAAAATRLSSDSRATRIGLICSATLLIVLGATFNRGYYIA